jgi:hypothetical protein
MKREYLEVTTQIGCPVNCIKYCPQQITASKYSGETTLSASHWKTILSHLPNDLPIFFSGFSEPFSNSHLIDLIEMAHTSGHPLGIFTTLYQASREDVQKLVKYQYLSFCLHLPDGNVMKFQVSQEYKDNVFTVLQNVKNASLSIMNDLFVDNNRENLTKEIHSRTKHFRFCEKIDYPQFMLLPNGNVNICCMDFQLKQPIGNLLTENYVDIKQRFLVQKKDFKLCSHCHYNISPHRAIARRVISKLRA